MPDSGARRSTATLLALGLLAALAAAAPGRAGTVVVTVRDTRGAPIEKAHVSLEPNEESGQRSRYGAWRGTQGETDLSGRVSLSVPAGRWLVNAWARQGDFVSTSDNPRLPALRIEVSEAGVVEVPLVLAAGGRVRARVECNRGAPRLTVRLDSLDGPTRALFSLSEASLAHDIIVLPGRWRVHADVPPGWLLTGLAVNGQALPGSDSVIAVEEGGDLDEIVLSLEGMLTIGGDYAIGSSASCVGTITAVLIEPGPWLAAAQARGGSVFRSVPAQVDRRSCTWDAVLPSGTWRFDVNCGDGCVVTPLSPVLSLAAGESRTLDFNGSVARREVDRSRREVDVTVLAPDGTPASGAFLEAWAVDGPLPTDAARPEPLGTGRTNENGLARLVMKPIAGAVRVIAGHPDHLDAEGLAPDPSATGATAMLTLTLSPAASLRIRASDADDRPLPGVEVVARITEEPGDLMMKPELRALRRFRDAVTDAGGALAWKGLPGGRWNVGARVTGADATAFLLEITNEFFTPEGRDPRLGRLQLTESEESELLIRVRPAARIVARLAPTCDDFPREVEARVAAASSVHPGDEDVDAALAEPVLQIGRVPRAGAGDSEITIGPLPTGSWFVAVRPIGFDRWTFAPGVETLADAAPVEAIEGSIAHVESLEVNCAPLIEVVPRVLAGGATPDLRLARVEATWTAPEATQGAAVAARAPRPLAVRLLRDSVRAEKAPDGRGTARFTLHHPHALPEPDLEIVRDVTNERGKRVRLVAEWAELGGAVSAGSPAPYAGARSAAPPAAEVSTPTWRRIVPVEASRALLPSLPAGAWIVADCADAACASSSRERRVLVEAGKTTIVE